MCMGLFYVTLCRWTDAYTDFQTGNLVLTAVAPLFDDSAAAAAAATGAATLAAAAAAANGTVLLGVSYSSQP